MSNLIKTAYFNVTDNEKRMIDSDSHVEEYIPGIYSQPEKPKTMQFPVFSEDDFDSADLPEGEEVSFKEGMNILSMDEVLENERKILSDELKIKADKILEDAKAEAERIIQEAEAEAEQIRSNAYEEGRESGISDGRAEAADELAKQSRQLDEQYNERLNMLEEQEKQLEPQFADIMTGLIGKVTGILCEDKKEVIIHLIDQALHGIERTSRILLRVSRDDLGNVTMKRGELSESVKPNVEFDIMEDASLSHNQCIIETDSRIIDCSLDTQLSSLSEQIRLLSL